MPLIEYTVFVVLQLSRGASTVAAVFHKRSHAESFMTRIRLHGGSYRIEQSILYDFTPDCAQEATK